jgi:hypothetical protein
MDIFQTDIEFKKNVGAFILTFSEIESTLSIILSKLENGLEVNPLVPEIFGADLSDKRSRIRRCILDNNSLLKRWDKLNRQLGQCNDFRRSIVHGIVMNQIINPSIQSLVRSNNGFIFKELTNEDVVKHLKILYDINSGKLGLGVFTEELNDWLKLLRY